MCILQAGGIGTPFFFSLHWSMEGPMESVNSSLSEENGDLEPCIHQVPFQDIPEPSGTCPRRDVVMITEPSSVHGRLSCSVPLSSTSLPFSFHVGPSGFMLGAPFSMSLPYSGHVGLSGSVLGTRPSKSLGPQLLPSSVTDSFVPHPPPAEPYANFLLRTGCLQLVQKNVGNGETGPVTSTSPVPDLWCLPWGRPTDQSCVSSAWTQNAAPQVSIHPGSVGLAMAWTSRRLIFRAGQPSVQPVPLLGPSAPDMVGRPPTFPLPLLQAAAPGTRTRSPPTPVVSAACMPHLLCPGPGRLTQMLAVGWTSHQYLEIRGPFHIPGLPSAIPQSASSRIFALHCPSRHTGLCFFHYAGLVPAAGEGPARCPSTSAIDWSLCPIGHGPRSAAAAQSHWQLKGINGWAQVRVKMSKGELQVIEQMWWSFPFRAQRRPVSGWLSPSLSSHNTSCSRSPSPKRHREWGRSWGRHHSRSRAGSWRASPPGYRRSCYCSLSSFRRHSPLLSRWPSPRRHRSTSQSRWPSPQWRYSPYQSRCSS